MEKPSSGAGTQGFTLIELMVTVAIIGILMAAGIVAFSNVQKAVRDAKRRADVDALAKALEQYYQDNGTYPYISANSSNLSPSFDYWDWRIPYYILGDSFPLYAMPLDPINANPYLYSLISRQQNTPGFVNPKSRFCVSARLENGKGNCTGNTGISASNPNSFQCNFVTPGTGNSYCVQNRQ